MEAIPYLIPYLSDTTETKAIRVSRRGSIKRPATVNEYMLFIINSITQHEFLAPETAEERNHKDVPYIPQDNGELETIVHLWWLDNRTLSLFERKVADLNDPFHPNRFSAYDFLGQAASEEARLALAKRFEKVLENHEMDILGFGELNRCATNLAKIDAVKSFPLINKLNEHYTILLEQGIIWVLPEIFKTLQLFQDMGYKKEAGIELSKLKEKYFEKLNPEGQKEFLASAEKMIARQPQKLH